MSDAKLKPVLGPRHAVCSQCGPHVSADVDGCCKTCGADCEIEPCNLNHAVQDELAGIARKAVRDLGNMLEEMAALTGDDPASGGEYSIWLDTFQTKHESYRARLRELGFGGDDE